MIINDITVARRSPFFRVTQLASKTANRTRKSFATYPKSHLWRWRTSLRQTLSLTPWSRQQITFGAIMASNPSPLKLEAVHTSTPPRWSPQAQPPQAPHPPLTPPTTPNSATNKTICLDSIKERLLECIIRLRPRIKTHDSLIWKDRCLRVGEKLVKSLEVQITLHSQTFNSKWSSQWSLELITM